MMHFDTILSAILLTGLTSGLPAMTSASAQTSTAEGQDNSPATLKGVISSIQIDNETTPAWITSGEWNLTTYRPLFEDANNSTENDGAQILGFDAVLYMISYANGTGFHKHTISDFSQTEVDYEGANATTIYGSMTVTDEDGVARNVDGFISL